MKNTERGLLLLIGTSGLLVVAAAVFFLLMRDPTTETVKTQAPAAALEAQPSTIPDLPVTTPDQTRTAVSATPKAPAPSQLPASYRESLGRVIGRVVTDAGEPSPNLTVEAYSVEPMQLMSDLMLALDDAEFTPAMVSANATTNALGRFELSGLEPRAVHVLGVDLGGARATARFLDNAPGPGETIDIGDLRLLPSVTFLGQVVDENQKPVAGARVRATDLPAIVFTSNVQDFRAGDAVLIREGGQEMVITPPAWLSALEKKLPFPTTKTGADGRFRLEGVPLGLATVLVDREGFVTLQHGPTPTGRSDERDLGTLVLSAGLELNGSVVDTTGKPVAQAEIIAGSRIVVADVAIMHPSEHSDASGKFRVTALKPGPAYVAARARAGDRWVVQPATPGVAVTVTLPATSELVVLVQDAHSTPIAKAKLQVWSGKDKEAAMLAPALRIADRIKVDDNGTYHLPDLAPGDYLLRVTASGYASAQATGHAGPGAVPIVVKLDIALPTTVTVESAASHEPVEYAQVAVNRDGSFPLFEPAFESVRTDQTGKATLRRTTVGAYDLTVTHPKYGFQTQKITLPQDNLVVRLLDGGAIEGHVRKAGGVPADLYLVALMPRGSDINMPRFTSTDLEGAFHFRNVGQGTYEVSIMERMLNKSPLALISSLEGGPLKEQETSVAAGQTTTLDIDLAVQEPIDGPAANLSGHLRVNGTSVVGARIHYWAQRERMAVTDQFGAFDLGRVPAGPGYLRVSQPADDAAFMGRNLWNQQLDLKENENKILDIDIATGKLRGRVRHQHDNTPAVQVPVEASRMHGRDDDGGGGQGQTVTDSSGAFELPSLPKGTYQVSVEEHGYARPRTTVTVEPGVEPTPIDIVLVSAVTVSGRIEIAGMEKTPKYVWVSFQPKGAEGVGSDHANVNMETLTFTTDGMAAGTYQATAHVDGINLKPIEFSVGQSGATDLLLRFAVEGQVIKGRVTLPPGAAKPRFLYIHFASKDKKDARGTQVDLETMTFNVQDLQGAYLAHGIAGNQTFDPVEVEVPAGATEISVQFLKEASEEH